MTLYSSRPPSYPLDNAETTYAYESQPPPAKIAPPTPFFFPPLWLSRRTACVEVLKKEGIRSVVDLGCGPGSLLQILSIPANHLDDFPEIYPHSPYSTSPTGDPIVTSRARKLDLLRSVPRIDDASKELHLRRLIGVDIRTDSLENAARVTAPPPSKKAADQQCGGGILRERWEDMIVELWEGGCEMYNEHLEGAEAMIATEVIEHLTPAALAKFPSMILGVYSPRIVVVTTPNHEFNPYFISSSTEEADQNRFPDPTGNTRRVFRDDDHQFEWTQEEFRTWAEAAADAEGYQVTFTGVGSLRHYYNGQPIPFPPPSLSAHPALQNFPTSLALPSDPSRFYATQIAIFRRQYPNEPERSPRSHRTTPLPFFSPSPSPLAHKPLGPPPPAETRPANARRNSHPLRPNTLVHRKSIPATPHVLIQTHFHKAEPGAGNPAEGKEILAALARLFQFQFMRKSVLLRDVWNRGEVRQLCAGKIGAVVEAVVEDWENEWDFVVDNSGEKKGDMALEIVWNGFVEDGEVGTRNNYDEDHADDEEEEEDEDDSDQEEIEGWPEMRQRGYTAQAAIGTRENSSDEEWDDPQSAWR